MLCIKVGFHEYTVHGQHAMSKSKVTEASPFKEGSRQGSGQRMTTTNSCSNSNNDEVRKVAA